MIDPVDPLMMRDRSDDDGEEATLLDLPASLRTGGGDGDIIGRAAMACNRRSESFDLFAPYNTVPTKNSVNDDSKAGLLLTV